MFFSKLINDMSDKQHILFEILIFGCINKILLLNSTLLIFKLSSLSFIILFINAEKLYLY